MKVLGVMLSKSRAEGCIDHHLRDGPTGMEGVFSVRRTYTLVKLKAATTVIPLR